ncbi:hypothetical protein SBA1_1410001 [Candidatus Sulfotelmatobacter kueseliae]|uniref:Uncharacterized protein n=1 Tax=Candidatus Sulfotelmatobacter kueseliae TaxID=2042962 RepID=A0A2U3K7M7_9BACT|nr:hypothetical protein SBA1_1410001 [Candidatus Sulfotelmatobacter kueseliae]
MDQLPSGRLERPQPPRAASAAEPLKGKVDCLAPGYNGFRALFQWETNRSADEAKPGQARRGL